MNAGVRNRLTSQKGLFVPPLTITAQGLKSKKHIQRICPVGHSKAFLKSVITIIKCLQWETVKRVRKYDLELEFNATKVGNFLQLVKLKSKS